MDNLDILKSILPKEDSDKFEEEIKNMIPKKPASKVPADGKKSYTEQLIAEDIEASSEAYGMLKHMAIQMVDIASQTEPKLLHAILEQIDDTVEGGSTIKACVNEVINILKEKSNE